MAIISTVLEVPTTISKKSFTTLRVRSCSRESQFRASPRSGKYHHPACNDNHHQHDIPNILIFTHRYNLLTTDLSINLPDVTNDERDELRALQRNVLNAIALHPGARVRFLTDEDCIQSIAAAGAS